MLAALLVLAGLGGLLVRPDLTGAARAPTSAAVPGLGRPVAAAAALRPVVAGDPGSGRADRPRLDLATRAPQHPRVPGPRGFGRGHVGLPSAGVDGSLADLTRVPPGWIASAQTLRSGGLERSYVMVRPPRAEPGPLPVVVVLSGRTEDPVRTERISSLIPTVGNAIMVYPAGYGDSWNAGACCGVAHTSGLNDVAFLEAVIHQVLASQPDAAPQRVYVLGFSNGGRMAYRLDCADPGVLAGVAVVEAVPVFDCHQLHPTPMVIVAQSADPLLTIPANGTPRRVEGYTEPTVQATVERWRRLEGCPASPSTTSLGSVRVATYTQCQGKGRLEYDLYAGGGHFWPRGNRTTPSAGQLIWAFLTSGGLPRAAGSPLPVAGPIGHGGSKTV